VRRLSTTGCALLAAALALAAPARSAVAAAGEAAVASPDTPHAGWDLLTILAAGTATPGRRRVTTLTNFGEQRRVVATAVPDRIAAPATIPPDAELAFGYAIQARIFSVDLLPKAGPTRFKVVFTGEDGVEHVLHERILNLRDVADDRRWFDERIDLAALAGRTGTLALSAERADDPAAPAETTALFAAPRIVRRAMPDDVNLLFVTIDCLRADHVGAYGYERPTTPAIDRIASEGVRFANAFSNAPMTLPSLPQIFTSSVFPQPGAETFIHPFIAAGIPNAAVVNNVWLVLWMSRSSVPFDTIVSGDLMAEQLTDAALAWLGRHDGSRFALYMHYLDAHTPYGGPTRYARLFKDPSYDGQIGDTFGDVAAANSGRYDERDQARIASLYDGQIRFIDDQLSRIFDFLRERGLLDRTVIAISADHGEELWDHGHFFHGQSLYDELLHVPVIVRLPGGRRAGTVVERPVRSIDIAPSLVEWAGLAPPSDFQGRPLSQAIAEPGAAGDDLIATATMGQFPTRYGIRSGGRKLIDTVDDGRRQLFDLAADPKERHDVLASDPSAGGELAAKLAAARVPLAHEGVQLRIVGPRAGRARFRLVLSSASKSGVFETIDRTAGPDDARIGLSSDGRRIVVHGAADADGHGFRFDRRLLLLAALGGKPDPIRARLTVDGAPAPRGAVTLGTGTALPPNGRFEVRSADLESATPPACPAPDTGVRVCLWRPPAAGAEPKPVAPPVADESARERLKALGYVQ